MAVDKLVNSTQLDTDLTSVANAIRTKGGTSEQLAFPSGFVSAIGDIPTGGTLITKTITENGTYSAEDDDADGYSEVMVNVSGGGSTMYSGEFTPAERTGIMTFYAPNCTYLAIMSFEAADKSTGLAFITSILGKVGAVVTVQSNNAGSNEAVSSGLASGIGVVPYYSYSNGTFTVNFTGNAQGNVSGTSKVPQVGRKYNWWAW